jgi:hypothetical protein
MIPSRSSKSKCVNSLSVFGQGKRTRQRSDDSTSRHKRTVYDLTQQQGRYQELARILGRIVEIGLQGGSWAEAQDGSNLQIPPVQSDLLQATLPPGPYANTDHTEPLFLSADTVLRSNDTQNIS